MSLDPPMAFGDWVKSRLFDQRTVLVSGELTTDLATAAAAELMTLDGEGDELVTLHLDCSGGSLEAAFTLIDVVDLPGAVMQEIHRRPLQQQIVVIGGAPQKRRQAGHMVGHLETQSLGEKLLGGLLIQRAHHHMTQPTRTHLVGALDRRGPAIGTIRATRPIHRFRLGR